MPKTNSVSVIECTLTHLMFAKDNGFTTEQMSAWFSIIKSVHEMAVGE